jgi:hypothetical protein
MKPQIIVESIEKKDKKVICHFTCSPDLEKYFNKDEPFFVEYGIDDSYRFDAAHIPDGVLIIPFLCNVLPIVWIGDAVLHIAEIDKTFYESIPEFKQGYIDLYPEIDFAGTVTVERIIESVGAELRGGGGGGTNIAFFSGGVVAFNTLINHQVEKPLLLTLWGSDVFFNDTAGWDNVKEHVRKTAEQFGVSYLFIKSNFRKFLNESALSKLVFKRAKDGWWHGFQCGIGLVGHSAPIAYLLNVKNIYSASSFTKDYTGPGAAFPSIEDHIRFSNSRIVHDGFELTRQDKIGNICNFSRKNNIVLFLRVCWMSGGGKNCSACEKCYRTIMGILAEDYDPNDFGLFYDKQLGSKIYRDITRKIQLQSSPILHFKYIQRCFRNNPNVFEKRKELKWILDLDFDKVNKHPAKLMYIFMKKCFNKIKSLSKKLKG